MSVLSDEYDLSAFVRRRTGGSVMYIYKADDCLEIATLVNGRELLELGVLSRQVSLIWSCRDRMCA